MRLWKYGCGCGVERYMHCTHPHPSQLVMNLLIKLSCFKQNRLFSILIDFQSKIHLDENRIYRLDSDVVMSSIWLAQFSIRSEAHFFVSHVWFASDDRLPKCFAYRIDWNESWSYLHGWYSFVGVFGQQTSLFYLFRLFSVSARFQ